jgi:5-formyltetrahydrofolate cyclo-ligase
MSVPSTSDDPGSKARLRREVRARRAALTVTTARAAARSAIHRLLSLPFMARARRIALYLPTGSELDCTPLALQAWARGRAVFLPVICGSRLRFAPFRRGADLRTNRFGILEPVTHARNLRSPRQLDVIVAPLIGFDRKGGRLGTGGGYYDRTLAFLKLRSCARRPHFVAVAFEIQKLDTVPVEEWDVCLDAIITEKATYNLT